MPGCYVVFHKQLGDLCLLEPAFAKLRAYHGAPIVIMTRSGHAPLLSLMPGVVYQAGFPLRWRSHLYCFDRLSKSAWRTLMAPAGRKQAILPEIEEVKWYHRPLFGVRTVPEISSSYVAEYFWEHTPVPSTEPFRTPKLESPPDDWKVEGVEKGSYVLLNPTSGWRQKMWNASRWAEVLRALHERHGWRFVMTSASTDWQINHCQEIAEQAGPIIQSLASGTTLKQFLWLCAGSKAVLTVDGAASHLSQAFGVPTLTLFGPTCRHNWHRATDVNIALQAGPSKDGKCSMRNLDTATVLEGASRLALS
jgi:ADP-heptose:LPS heptosyltransferase